MPIEIRELVIKTTVGSETPGNSSGASNAGTPALREQDIALIVEKILQILREKSER